MKKLTYIKLILLGLVTVSACETRGFSSTNSNFDSSNESITSSIEDSHNSEKPSRDRPSRTDESSSDASSKIDSSSSSVAPSSASSNNPSSSTYTTSISVDVDSRWNVNFNEYGSTFRNTLSSLIDQKRKRSCSYSNCLSEGAKAAAYPNKSSSTFVPFYHGPGDICKQNECNREHTWPNSRGTGSNGFNDPFIIRPTLTKDNSSRGNYFYGLGGKGSQEWDPASLGYEPARGESARIIFYVATAYASKGLSLSNNPGDSTGAKTMGTLKTLYDWNKKYPVTDMERQINDYYDSQGYGRNPFVDHPEYVEYIWDASGLRTSPVNGGGGGNTSSMGGNSSTKPVTGDYSLFTSINDLDGSELAIVTSAPENATTYYALTNSAKGDNLPWYLVGTLVDVTADMGYMSLLDQTTPFVKYKFELQGDGTFGVYDVKTKKYLYSYIDGSHYSLSLGDPGKATQSKYWGITPNAKGFCFRSPIGVYLEYYKGSFCGYNNQPKVPIYLYK